MKQLPGCLAGKKHALLTGSALLITMRKNCHRIFSRCSKQFAYLFKKYTLPFGVCLLPFFMAVPGVAQAGSLKKLDKTMIIHSVIFTLKVPKNSPGETVFGCR
jgi:hypothetical protein